ncbi:MAG TPA: hypothetical protein VJ840_18705 [Gemmatimonadaceae bacterium]|nr:hypothetical protein [Gemmatimonadaceae bacterium]
MGMATAKDDIARRVEKIRRIIDGAKVQTSRTGHYVHFDGVVVEPFDMMKLDEHLGAINELLKGLE